MGCESIGTDDCIVAIVDAVATRPECETGGLDRPVKPACELQDAGERGFSIGRQRRRLDDADIRMCVHETHEPDKGVAGHNAVRVEHDYIAVVASPALDEILDVAGFASDIPLAAAIIDRRTK